MERLPPLRLLIAFDEVARRGSMRAAAARLNVTQPAVTQAIRSLEEHLGLVLLDRSTRPARLTEAGEELARAVRLGFETITSTIEALQARTGPAQNTLTVACTLGMATYWLMPRLPAFYARRPDLVVNVQAPPMDAPGLTPGVDLALRYGSGTWDDGETWTLFGEIIRPVGRPDLVDRLRADGAGLEAAPLIHVRSAPTQGWEGWREYFARSGLRAARGPAHVYDNYVQAVQAALDGRGLMLGWRSITSRLEHDGALAAWPGGERDWDTRYCVTVSPAGAAKPVTAAFVDWLVSAAEDVEPSPARGSGADAEQPIERAKPDRRRAQEDGADDAGDPNERSG